MAIATESRNIHEALEVRLYKRILRISWKDSVTNGEVLKRVKEKRALIKAKQKRRDTPRSLKPSLKAE